MFTMQKHALKYPFCTWSVAVWGSQGIKKRSYLARVCCVIYMPSTVLPGATVDKENGGKKNAMQHFDPFSGMPQPHGTTVI